MLCILTVVTFLCIGEKVPVSCHLCFIGVFPKSTYKRQKAVRDNPLTIARIFYLFKFPSAHCVVVPGLDPSCSILRILNMLTKVSVITAWTTNCFAWNSCWFFEWHIQPVKHYVLVRSNVTEKQKKGEKIGTKWETLSLARKRTIFFSKVFSLYPLVLMIGKICKWKWTWKSQDGDSSGLK